MFHRRKPPSVGKGMNMKDDPTKDTTSAENNSKKELNETEEDNADCSLDFILDKTSIDTEVVKRIGIDGATESLSLQIYNHVILQRIYLNDFNKYTIKPLKEQLDDALHNCAKDKRLDIINSIMTFINRNIKHIIYLQTKPEVRLGKDEQDKHIEIISLKSDKYRRYLARIFRKHQNGSTDNDDLEKILASLVDKNGVCKTCGQDHSFKPTFQDTKASIDVMPQVFRKDQNSKARVGVTT